MRSCRASKSGYSLQFTVVRTLKQHFLRKTDATRPKNARRRLCFGENLSSSHRPRSGRHHGSSARFSSAGPTGLGLVRPGSAWLDQARLGSARLGSAWLGSARLGSVQFGWPDWARLGSARLGSARFDSTRLDSARLGSARLGSARLGSARLNSTQLNSTQLDSARLGSAWLGWARPGSTRLRSTRLRSARLDPVRLGSARLGLGPGSGWQTVRLCQTPVSAHAVSPAGRYGQPLIHRHPTERQLI